MLSTAPGAVAATRHATPAPAAGADCSAASPCSLADAFAGAAGGDAILLGPGSYPGETAYSDTGRDLSITGAVIGIGRPVVSGRISLSGAGSHLSDVHVESTTPSATAIEVLNGASADRVIGTSHGGDGCTIGPPGSSITNSLCESLATNHSGLASQGAASGTMTAHNVTAVGNFGLFTNAGTTDDDPGLTIDDSFVRADPQFVPRSDLRTNSGQTTLAHVNFEGHYNTGGSVVVINKLTSAPGWVGGRDYRLAAGSSSIDAGSNAAGDGELDLNGNLRRIGTSTDTGAYEFVPAAPAVTVNAPSPSATAATVNATIDAAGARTRYRVRYGPTDAHGSTTPDQILPAAAGATAVQIAIPGLSKQSTYHYVIEAESDGGSATTPDASFTTLPLPPVATTSPASGIASTTATLHGTVETDGVPATIHFDVTPAGGPTFSTPAQPSSGGAVSAPLTGLAPGTAYSYALVARSAGGESASARAMFTTATLTPALRLLGAKGKKAGQLIARRAKVLLGVRCGALACTVTKVTGKLKAGGKRLGRLTVPKKAIPVAAGSEGKVKLRTSRKLRALVRRQLRRSKKPVRLKVRAVVADAGGATASRSVSARIPKR